MSGASSQAGLAAVRYGFHPGDIDQGPVPALVQLDRDEAAAEARSFGFNLVTIAPDGTSNGPRLRGSVSRDEAQAELDELAPFMTDGYTTVLVELREVAS